MKRKKEQPEPARAEVLLTDPSACLRVQVLRDLLLRPRDDEEILELAGLREKDPLVTRILEGQDVDGSFRTPGENRYSEGRLTATSLALSRLGFLGFDSSFPPVARGAKWLFSRQKADGSWPLGAWPIGEGSDEEGQRYSMIPLQTAFPLAGLARVGYADDPRAERAYGWLLEKRLPDGAWPGGVAEQAKPARDTAGGVHGYVAGYRRLPHSRWGCRTNTTESLICLSLHPTRRHREEARRALDHLLGRETRERRTLGFETARLAGFEEARGYFTFHAAFDPALVLELCARIGAPLEDQRVAELSGFIEAARGEFGLWEYPSNPRASAWVSFTLHRALSALQTRDSRGAEWTSMEPRTPFAAYPKKKGGTESPAHATHLRLLFTHCCESYRLAVKSGNHGSRGIIHKKTEGRRGRRRTRPGAIGPLVRCAGQGMGRGSSDRQRPSRGHGLRWNGARASSIERRYPLRRRSVRFH